MSSVVVEDAPKSEVVQEKKAIKQEVLPPKFAGKSAKDIADSYQNLEKELGRKSQEIGELRKLSDSFLQAEISRNASSPDETNPSQPETTTNQIDTDEYFNDPANAVNSAIENHPQFKELRKTQETQAKSNSKSKLNKKHPDYQKVVSDPKFQEWVNKSNIRKSLYEAADGYNFEAADELIGNFKSQSTVTNTNRVKQLAEAKRKLALKRGTTESRASVGSVGGKKTFRRADLIRLKIENPNKYDSMQDEIFAAYADNRVK